jgi:SAM-dependent methyltransferase
MKRLALDAGAGPGRVAIELGLRGAKFFDKVEAFDYSDPFVGMMQKKLKELKLEEKVIGYQADAHDILQVVKEPNPEGKFDLVFCCNLIDRLHTPTKFVKDAVKLLNPKNGLLIVSSPYTWKPEHTAQENWIGGKFVDAEKYFTEQGLEDMLRPLNAEMREVLRVPFAIPDEDGTFQVTFSNCTVFQMSG